MYFIEYRHFLLHLKHSFFFLNINVLLQATKNLLFTHLLYVINRDKNVLTDKRFFLFMHVGEAAKKFFF